MREKNNVIQRDHTRQYPQHQQKRNTIVVATKCLNEHVISCTECARPRTERRAEWSQSQRRSHGLMAFTSGTVKRINFQSTNSATNRSIVIVVTVNCVVTNGIERDDIMAENKRETRKTHEHKISEKERHSNGKTCVGCASANNNKIWQEQSSADDDGSDVEKLFHFTQ